MQYYLLLTNILVIYFGACVGSFLNVCIARLPKGANLAYPRSHCPHCKKTIPWYYNFPIFSFLWLRARCVFCKNKISWRYFIVEVLMAALVFWFYLTQPTPIAFPFAIYFLSALVIATFIDLEHWIIPDKITLPGIIIGLIGSLLIPNQNPINNLVGALFGGFSLFAIAWSYERFTKKEGLGGGDVKLLAMIGAFVGIQGVAATLIISSFSGAIAGMIVMAVTKKGLKTAIPFGPFLSLGALFAFFFGEQFWTWYFQLHL